MPLSIPVIMGLSTAVGAGASLGGAALAGRSATNAAKTQTDAATSAAQLQAQSAAEALAEQRRQFDASMGFQSRTYEQGRTDLAPWLQTGQGALGLLNQGIGISGAPTPAMDAAGRTGVPEGGAPGAPSVPGGDLLAGYDKTFDGSTFAFDPSKYGFTPPTVTDDPGFQFRLQEGQKALERSAAARGTLMSGGTLKALTNYAQGAASQEYQNAFNRSLAQNELAYGRGWQENQQGYNRALGEYQQNYNVWNQNQANRFNRLASLAGVGQTAAGQLGAEGANAAGLATQTGNNAATNVANILLGNSRALGDIYQNSANAQAAGQVASGNAWNGALSGIGQNATNAAMLWYLNQGQQPATTTPINTQTLPWTGRNINWAALGQGPR